MPAFDVDALRPSSRHSPGSRTAGPSCSSTGRAAPRSRSASSTRSADYYTDTNANSGGAFVTSELSDAMTEEAHAAVADFLGAASPDEIKFGYNMSTLTLHIGRSIGATLGPGDEIVVTTLDHEANVSTWEAMAADRGSPSARSTSARMTSPSTSRTSSRSWRRGRSSSRWAMPATRSARSTRSPRSSPAPTRSAR